MHLARRRDGGEFFGWDLQRFYIGAARFIHIALGRAKESDGVYAQSAGKVRDAAVVADKSMGDTQKLCHFRQRYTRYAGGDLAQLVEYGRGKSFKFGGAKQE